MTCARCGRVMRGKYVHAADAPGTVVQSSRGLCGTCYQRAWRAGKHVQWAKSGHLPIRTEEES